MIFVELFQKLKEGLFSRHTVYLG